MSQPSYSLPPRKWYTLEQATKRIAKLTGEEIDVADLLHFWKTYQLEICTPIYYFKEQLNLGGVEIKRENIKEFDIDFFFKNENYSFATRLEHFSMITTGKKINGVLFAEMDGMINLQPHIIYYDAFSVAFEFIAKEEKAISFFESIDYLTIQERDAEKIYFKLILNEDIKIPLSNLFILNDELDLFLQGKSNAIETAKEIEDKKNKEPSPTIQENQINFIKGLLYLHYGIKTPNEAKNAMNTGKLGQDIARLKREQPNIEEEQNFKFPTGGSLFNWYSKT